tara:strand:- start:123 stop:422 length:300 start_codon:yes stop_codon:yes gene_type:complete
MSGISKSPSFETVLMEAKFEAYRNGVCIPEFESVLFDHQRKLTRGEITSMEDNEVYTALERLAKGFTLSDSEADAVIQKIASMQAELEDLKSQQSNAAE